MREQTRLINLSLTEEDVADGFSVKETGPTVFLLRHGRVIAEFSRPGAKGLLSRRETEILQYVARGDETREIASALGLKRQTVKNDINRVIQKLGAKNRAHAVALALRNGVIN